MAAFTCSSTIYQVVAPTQDGNSQFREINAVTGQVTLVNTDMGDQVNAIGYNVLDNYIYGLTRNETTNVYSLVRVETGGVITTIGPLPNLPNIPGINTGTMDNQGFLYVKHANVNQAGTTGREFYTIDLRPGSASYGQLVDPTAGYTPTTSGTPINPAQSTTADWVYNVSDGQLYTLIGLNSNNFGTQWASVNPTTGALTGLSMTGSTFPTDYGASAADASGFIYGISNSTGEIIRWKQSAGVFTGELFSQSLGSDRNDATMCQLSRVLIDFGDAPNASPSTAPSPGNYRTMLAANGPRHELVNNLKLGTTVTAEDDANQNATATGDDIGDSIQDDGTTVPLAGMATTDTTYTLPVSVFNDTGSIANIYGWIDFNKDGIFQTNEAATATLPSSTTNPRSVNLTFTVPSGTTLTAGDTFVRVRTTTESLANTGSATQEDTRSYGPARDGEVEDYRITIGAPQINATKTVDKTTVNTGDDITYTVTLTNPSTVAANNVVFTDPTPAGTTYNNSLSVSSAYTGTSPATGLTITSIPPGGSVTISWKVKVGATLPNPNPIPNVGTVTGPGIPTTPTNQVITGVLNKVKTVDKQVANIGDDITYTVTITNPGTTAATNVLFTDPTPSGTTYNNSLSVSSAYTGTDPATGLTIASIPAGGSVTISWKVKVGSTLPNPNPIPNTGTVTVPGGSPSPTNTVTTTVLDIDPANGNGKSVDKAVANIGDIITYTVKIRNPSTTAVSNVLFTDATPAGTTYNGNLNVSVPYTGSDPATGLTLTSIPAGGTATISWQVKVGNTLPNPNPIPNTGVVTVPGGNPTPTNTVTTTVLDISTANGNGKSVDKTVANVGDIITYTVKIRNPSTTAVSNISFQDAIPSGTTYNGNLAVNVPYTGTDPQTGLTLTSIPAGGTATISWQVKVGNTLPTPNPIPNTGIVTVPGGTPTSTNQVNTAIVSNVKSVDKAVANIGDIITYTVVVSNPSTTAVNNILFRDPTPAGTTYNGNLAVSVPYTGSDPATGLTLTSIPAGGSATISWQVKIGDTLPNPNPIPNTATVTVPGGSPSPTNTVTTTVLDINPANGNGKSVDKAVANIGDIITYTVKIKNPSTTAVSNVLFTDATPAGTTYNGNLNVSVPYTGNDPATGLTLTSIPAGATATISWQVKVGNTLPNPNPIPNTGVVTVPGGSPTPTNTVTTTVIDISTTNGNGKSVDKTVANVGDIITYTVKIKNPGPTTINNIAFQDAIPAGTTYNDNLTVNVPYTGIDPQTGLVLTSIPAGETAVISWQVKVGNSVPTPNPIPNTGVVTVPGGTPTPTNQVNTAIIRSVKSVDKVVANIGDIITYTVVISNPSTTTANNILFKDPTPAGTTYNGNLAVTVPYTGADPITGITLTSIPAGGSATVSWQVKVGNTLPNPNPIPNTATSTAPGGTPTSTNTVNTTVIDISTANGNGKSVDKAVANIGDDITYTVKIKNPGATVINNIAFQDAIPAGTTYNNSLSVSTAYTGTDPQSGLTITAIQPGETVTISWKVKVGDTLPNPNPIPNTGIVTVPGGNPTPTNTVNTTVIDISTANGNGKSVDKTQAGLGDIITYTVKIRNPGPTPVTNVFFQDAIPAGTIYNDSLTVNVPYTGVDPATGLTLTSIPAGGVATISWQVKVNSTAPNPNPIPNIGVVTVPGGKPVTTNQVNTAIITAVKSVDKTVANVGDIITYSVVVTNPSTTTAATNIAFQDAIPAGTTYNGNLAVNVPYTGTNPQTGLTLTSIPPASSATISWQVKVGNTLPVPNPIPNAATTTVPGGSPVTTNTVNTTVLDISTANGNGNGKTVDKTVANIGDIITYTVKIRNPGPTAVNNIVFKDPTPAGTTYNDNLSVSTAYTGVDPASGLTITTIQPGEVVTISWQVKVNNSVPLQNPIPNTGTVTVPGGSPTPTNQVSTVILDNEKTVDKTIANIGDDITYTVTVRNPSNRVVNNIFFQDAIPAGTTYNDSLTVSTGYTGTDPQTGLTLSTIQPGETVTIKWKVKVGNTLPNPNPIVNVATITPPGGEPTPTNPVTTTVLDNNKKADKVFANPGEIITYTVTVKNPGSTVATNVAFQDAIPAGTTYNNNLFVSSPYTGVDPQSGLTLTAIQPGETVTIKWEVKVGNTVPTPNPIPNSATITVTGGKPTPTPQVTTTILDNRKTVDKAIANVGDEITYTVTLKNPGTTAVSNVLFQDAIPAGTTYNGGLTVSLPYTGTDPQTGLTITSIPAGGTATISWKVKVGNTLPNPNPIPNTGIVTIPGGTPSPTNTVNTTVLDISTANGGGNGKTVDKAVANVGDTITYTIKIKNPGPTAATNVFFQDAIPAGTTYDNSLTVSVPYTGVTPQAGLTLTSIPAGETAVISWKVKVGNTVPNPNPVTNIGTVTVPGGQPTPTNPVTTTIIDIDPANGNGKSVDKAVANTGDIITYTVKIKNPTATAVSNIAFKDAIPAGTTYNDNLTVSVPYTGTDPQTGLTLTTIPANTTAVISWQVKVGNTLPNPNPIPNTAIVTVPGGNPTSTNTVNTTVLDITTSNGNGNGKSVDKPFANVGEVITYTVKIKNPGATAVNNIIFQDAIPTGTTYNNNLTVNLPYTGTNPQTGITITSIPAGETAIITWQVKVATTVPTPNPVVNIGTVTVPGGQPTPTNPVTTTVLDNNKTADKQFVNIGDDITYTVTIKNPGTTIATNVLFQDNTPAGTMYNDSLTVSTSYNGTDPATGLLFPIIKAGETVTIKWKVKVLDTSLLTNPITNQAVVTISGGTPTPTKPTTTTVLENSKEVDKKFANVGENITYTVKIKNPGTTAVTNVAFQDNIPAGTVYNNSLTVSVPYTGNNPQTGLTLSSIGAGQTAIITWKVKVTDTVPTVNPVTNIATITIPGGKPTPTKPVTTTILDNNKVVDKAYGDVGEVLTYTVTIKNPGTEDANGIVFQDDVPSGTTYNDNLTVSTAYTGTDPQTGLTLTKIKAGETVVISWRVKVGDTLPTPNPVTNVGIVTIPGGTPTPTNPAKTQINTVDINKPGNNVKTADKVKTAPGDIITYTITVKNTGNVPGTNVIVKDTVPVGTSFVPGTVTINGVPQPGETPVDGINVGTINPGETKVITFKVLVGENAPDPIINTASTTYTYKPDPTKPPITPPPTVTPPVVVETLKPGLTIAKTSNRTGAQVGDIITYTLKIQNTGEMANENVIVKDVLTTDLAFANNVKLNGTAIAGNIISGINIGNLAIGAIATLTFDVLVVSVPTNKDKTAVNQAEGSYTYKPNPTDPAIPGTTTSNKNDVKIYSPAFKVTKTSNKASVLAGVPFTYDITIANVGDIILNDVILQDALPSGFNVTEITLDGSTITGNLATGINIGSLNIGQSRLVKVTVVIEDTVNQGQFKNVAVVNGKAPVDPNFPPVPVKGTGTDSTNGGNGINIYNPKLVLRKSADKSYAVNGDIVTYKIVATNEGNVALNNVQLDNVIISDILSNQLEFIAGSVTVNEVSVPEDNIIAGVGIDSLAVGESKTITFKVKVLSAELTPIINQAKAEFTFKLPGENEVSKGASSNPYDLNVYEADLEIIKTASADEVLLGDTITYTVKITNTGTLVASSVLFKDNLPQEVSLVPGSFMVDGKVINGVELATGIIVSNIAPGETLTITYKVKVVGSNCSSTITNQAKATFDYRLPDGMTGSKESTGGDNMTNSTTTAVGITTFKQLSVESYLGIPEVKPDIETINTVTGTIDIAGCHVINTPQTMSVEGQKLTGYKLIVRGTLNVVIEYTALDIVQSVHSAHYTVPFSTFIVLPPTYQVGSKLEVTGLIEDIYYKSVDIRNFFQNTTALVNVKILSC